MKQHLVFLFTVLSLVISHTSQSSALPIKQGTIAIDGSSDAFNESRRFDKGNDSDEYGFSINGSYFIIENIEIGSGLSYDYYKSKTQKITSWTLSPFIQYHFSINEKSNIYGGGGVLLTNQEIKEDPKPRRSSDSSGIKIKAGWEYFFNSSVALDISFSYRLVQWDLSGYSSSSDKENRFYWPSIGIRVFF
jgi:opacity protein-like surface antigen